MKPKRPLRDVFNLRRLRNMGLPLVATMAIGTGCMAENRIAVQPLPASPVTPGCVLEVTTQTPKAPKLPYDEELLRENDSQPPSQAVLAMTPEERIQYYMAKFCFTADQAANDNSSRDKVIVSALNTLNTVTFMGKPLIDLSAEAHLHFCALKHMPAGTAAQYLPSHDLVAAGQNAKKQGQVLDIAHELVHASQDRNGLLNYNFSWDIESRVRRNLVDEAAPIALEYAVAYEMKLNGDDSYWKYLDTHDANTAYTSQANHKLFEQTYRDSIAAGSDSPTALRAAAHKIFEKVFESDDWKRFYLTSELNSYIEDIAEGKFADLEGVDHNAFDQSRVDLAGKIGTLPSYTEGAQVPAYADILKYDQKMAWAYEAADIARYRQQLGATDPVVVDLEQKAAADKNPYVGLDIARLSHRIEEARWKSQFKTTWQLMDEQLKDKSVPAVPPANVNCAPDKAPETQKPAVPAVSKTAFGVRRSSF